MLNKISNIEMSLNYPEFLVDVTEQETGRQKPPPQAFSQGNGFDDPEIERKLGAGAMDTVGRMPFNDLLFDRLGFGEKQRGYGSVGQTLEMSPPGLGPQLGSHLTRNDVMGSISQQDAFSLPSELQGGVGNISSRRPSYAAESFTRSHIPPNFPMFVDWNLNYGLNLPATTLGSTDSIQRQSVYGGKPGSKKGGGDEFLGKGQSGPFEMLNPYQGGAPFDLNQLNDSLGSISLNTNFSDFQSRRPSQLAEAQNNALTASLPLQYDDSTPKSPKMNTPIKLENGLDLQDQYIMASDKLRSLFLKTSRYFESPELGDYVVSRLTSLLESPVIMKLITFIKNLNNLSFNHKVMCLVVNKNGKFDLLSYPYNSNICLQKNDLVLVDGDRGKDLVMVLEPLVSLDFAILFNFLKKLEHLKSLTVIDNQQPGVASSPSNPKGAKKVSGGTHPTSLNASVVVNSHINKDNEFIITLPTKQVLRFATPKEIFKLSGKFLEEKKAFLTCFNKIKELDLHNDLELINVEYQFDLKKLIFYYFAGFKRIDFRGLIKELFKIYKTRIWLCAVLPFDKPELYVTGDVPKVSQSSEYVANRIPEEYELTNEQILSFSINEFDNLATPSYFHLKNFINLITHLSNEIEGNFYGFNVEK